MCLEPGSQAGNVKWVLLAVLAAFAAVVIFYFGASQTGTSEEVAGTIGAVQKYRAEQFSEADMLIAGQEAEADIHFSGDLLDDASVLQNAAVQLANLARELANRGEFEQKELESFRTEMGNVASLLNKQEADLGNRLLENATRQLEAVQRNLQNHAEAFENSTLGELEARMANVTKELQNREQFEQRSFENAWSELEAAGRLVANRLGELEARSFENFRGRMDNFARELENRNAELEQRSLENFRAELENAERPLAARYSLQQRSLESRHGYLEAISLQHRELANAQRQLGNLARELEGRARLRQAELANAAEEMGNLSRQFNNRAAELEQRSLANMQKQLEAYSLRQRELESARNSLDSFSKRLDNRRQLEQRSLGNVRNQLQAFERELASNYRALAQRSLGQLQSQAMLLNRHLENRAGEFNSRSLDGFTRHVGNLTKELESRAASLENKALENMRSQVGSASRHLEAQVQLQNRAIQ